MRLSISDVLDAYRADLSNANRAHFSECDSTWLAFGTQLQRAASLPTVERIAYLRAGASKLVNESAHNALSSAIGALAIDDDGAVDWDDALCAAAMFVSADAEDAGAFALATLLLDFARVLVHQGEILLQGRMLGRQARILRKLGEMDAANELYSEVATLGAAHREYELVALAHIGKGVVARMRGNYPQARSEFLAALSFPAETDDVRDLQVNAHHGLLVVSAIARDFDTALTHGSLAMAGARSEDRRVELLLNLANVCYDAGQFRSSLHGFLHVLAKGRIQRVLIPAFGGAAVSAARLHDAATVDALATAMVEFLAHARLEYELADMTREFAEAYAYLGDAERAATYQQDALARARRGGFFEIIHRLESFALPPTSAQPPEVALTDDALAVTSELASGNSDELLFAAVSGGQQWRLSGFE